MALRRSYGEVPRPSSSSLASCRSPSPSRRGGEEPNGFGRGSRTVDRYELKATKQQELVQISRFRITLRRLEASDGRIARSAPSRHSDNPAPSRQNATAVESICPWPERPVPNKARRPYCDYCPTGPGCEPRLLGRRAVHLPGRPSPRPESASLGEKGFPWGNHAVRTRRSRPPLGPAQATTAPTSSPI